MLALVAATALVLDGRLVHGSDTSMAAVVALALATCLPFVLGRHFALANVLALEAGLAACLLVFRAYDAAVAILAIVLFVAALEGDRRRAIIVGAATAVVLVLTLVLLQTTGHAFEAGTALRVLLVLAGLVIGDATRSRRALSTARRERAAQEQHEREQQARERLARERLTIAREIHDTLAHALVAINVRAGVTNHLAAEPHNAGALDDIKQVSAQALRDLRGTLDLLRDGSEASPLQPAEDLEQLPQLLEGLGSTGLETRADVDVDHAAVPAPVSQAAFRIVQESLTNVLRHAGATHANIDLRVSGGMLTVEITDDGRGNADGAGKEAGHGLLGMSERVHALGGELSAGPAQPQGWRVLARLPVAGEEART